MKSILLTITVVVALTCIVSSSANATVITPGRGGSNLGGTAYDMIMPIIRFDGSNVTVQNMMGMPWMPLMGTDRPVMRPCLDGQQLSTTIAPTIPQYQYDALNGTAWNWQYGWYAGTTGFGPAALPANTKIWLEVDTQDAGIKVYDRAAGQNWAQILNGTGELSRWQWNETGGMAHNAYTVTPGIGEWSATYKVYLGYKDAVGHTNGEPVPGYGNAMATLTWTSIPEPATIGLLAAGAACLMGRRRKH